MQGSIKSVIACLSVLGYVTLSVVGGLTVGIKPLVKETLVV